LRYLLDSHTLLWFLAGASKLSDKARRIIEHPDHDILTSIASLWEIGIKHSLGKLNLHRPFAEVIPHHLEINSIAILGLRTDHVLSVTKLPFHHRDPFDRILVAQALVEEIPIVSCDDALDLYRVERIW
jgi:PIN domain nuclease of toxin-antitoxin system